MAISLEELLKNYKLIPSAANKASLKFAVEQTDYPCIMLKMGDINTLRKYTTYIHEYGKTVMVHIDSIKGIAKDKAGFHYMKRIGVDAIISMKPQYIKMIREEDIHAILGVFLVDSASVSYAVQNIHFTKPDSVIVMPMTIPDETFEYLQKSVNVPILAGGLGIHERIISHVLSLGITACPVTNQELLKKYMEEGDCDEKS
ncbi:MAG: glycerol-3-phosphate responsive antiterminator [Eubacterium sp.]|nr:glycerol-3-phosphate responsive antiterminator [Eubacterium sp.]